MKKNLLLILVISLSTYLSYGQNETWKGRWITHSWPPPVENSWTCFVKEVEISSIHPQGLIARISADSKYWLWINDSLVVFEGQLKRGPTPKDTYYEEVDIGPFLRTGKNDIAVLVWYWGRSGYCHNDSGEMGFLFEAQSSDVTIVSDHTWKSKPHPAFGNTSDPLPNFRLPEYNIKFYSDKDLEGWKRPGFSKDWSNVLVVGEPGVAPWNRLWKRPFPQWKNTGIVNYENKLTFPFISDGSPVKMKLPKNYSITPYLKVEAQAGQLIDIRTDNYMGGSEYNVRTEYVTKSGMQEFETFGYMNGHEVIYSIPAGVKVMDLKYRRTSFPTEHIGRFRSDDQTLNSLWEKSLNTMDLNMRDAVQDPDRERAQWWGDAVILMGQIFYTCDTNGHRILEKAMSNLVEWQTPQGVLYSPVPAGELRTRLLSPSLELPTQMLASIGKYGFWTYFKYTGDTSMVAYVYPHVKKYLSLWHLGDDGLVVHRNGDWNWYDWGKEIDEKVLDNAWYYLALDGAMNMAKVIGEAEDAAQYSSKMKILKNNFNKRLWNGSEYRSPEYKGLTDDRGHGLAVVAGLAEPHQFDAIQKVLAREFHAGPYLEKYVLESFFLMNRPHQGLERMKNRYLKMIESPVTTLWEGWDIGDANYGGGSYNHGWSGGPLTLMHQYVAGISPLEPNYNTYAIKPQLGTLREVYCLTPTLKGNIEVEIKSKGRSFQMTVSSPPKTLASINIPRASLTKKLYVNGELIWSEGKPTSNVPGVLYKGKDSDYLQFIAKPGKWNFSTTRDTTKVR
ncbi:MAG TPA: GH116 family glycosyl hydrolase [Chitinophagaceae bacterium]|nr:GH116 family glycosyl hydrolase [Chitinophagaceae bacterium]